MGLLSKIFGDPNEKEVAKLRKIVDKINDLEEKYIKFSDQELKNKTKEFKNFLFQKYQKSDYQNLDQDAKKIADLNYLDEILPDALAVAREAAKRQIGQRPYDVQLIGAITLHKGMIAEMKTGEGKTLVASLALYLNALTGRGCHLVTPNDYLSRVGGGWMAPIYHSLDISVSAIAHDFSGVYDPDYTDPIDHGDERLNHWKPVSRAQAYQADIVYGTNNEFGFDYLRDNMAIDISQVAQRPFNFAIVDEVDSILIDEARTPLIISAPAEESASLYQQFAQLVKNLVKDEDYTIDEKDRAVNINDSGIKKMEEMLGIDNIYETKGVKYVHHLEEALKAEYIFKKDKDYVVKDNEIVIVDEFTGRLMEGRRYSGGLHQAIEAKEKVEVKRESDTLATISFQNLFRMYPKLAGMTGTAATEAEEFSKIYKLDVLEIPTNREIARTDKNDEIYKTEQGKLNAVIEYVREKNKIGQPVLIGTISIEKNEYLSKLLKRNGIKHNILNAKAHEKEAKIIAEAGKIGAVTLATNMAGRGVDILLGGKQPIDKKEVEKWKKENEKVLNLGGLCVIGTERHESRRIDNQLRGRAGRQGDPGESIFFVSMDDDLMRIFGGDRIKMLMERLGLPDDQSIKHPLISRSIEQAQRKVEGHNFDIRKHLVEYDDIMNKHREVVYKKRKKILELDPKKNDWLHNEIESILEEKELENYSQKVEKIGIENARQLEKMIYLRTIDTLWIEHLNTMTELRESVGLRGYGQRDPLLEYKQEAYILFQELIKTIENRVLDILIKLKIEANPSQSFSSNKSENIQNKNIKLSGANLSSGGFSNVDSLTTKSSKTYNSKGVSVTVRTANSKESDSANIITRTQTKVGRNDPCPCGSGKKYKKCCGK